jgi:hypothetical protein
MKNPYRDTRKGRTELFISHVHPLGQRMDLGMNFRRTSTAEKVQQQECRSGMIN